MSRHLVICTDGTWNSPDQADRDRMVPTNVAEVARATSGFAIRNSEGAKVPQLVYYDTGVGTNVGSLRKCLEGATGMGLRRKVLRAYTAIATTYVPGDKLFLFGFSRGAYTARSLAGLIGLCGLPDVSTRNRRSDDLIRRAFDVYRTRNVKRRLEEAADYASRYSHKVEGRLVNEIHFIGVWDTVGALGVPWWPLRWIMRNSYIFHDVTLGPHIKHAYHAVAIDERRRFFAPALWLKGEASAAQIVEQVWFPGVHANVGGGYVDSGLGDRALLWMCLKAAGAGLGLKAEYMNLRVDPNYHGELRESCRHVFRLTSKGRRIGGKWKNEGKSAEPVNEKIHFSAKERFEHATEIVYREKHRMRSLGLAIGRQHPPVADKEVGEVDCHRRLTGERLNDGGGTPASFPALT